MRIEEARWIEQLLTAKVLPVISAGGGVALNLGSGTRKAREGSKHFIQSMTIDPMLAAGLQVVHSDLLAGDGVDLSGDLFDAAFQARLQELRPKIVMFCNVLEHLPNHLRTQVPDACTRILAPGGFLIVTVPNSYPYHADPIDTMYRPTATQVAALFPSLQVVDAQVIDSESYWVEFMQGGLWRQLRKLLRLLFPFVRPKRWLSHAHRFLWLGRPYRHSCVLLRKPA